MKDPRCRGDAAGYDVSVWMEKDVRVAGIVIAAPLPLVGRGSLTQATAFQILPIAYNPAVRRGAEALLLDCIGFVEAHRRQLAHASGLPVILSNALMAKIVGEMVAG